MLRDCTIEKPTLTPSERSGNHSIARNGWNFLGLFYLRCPRLRAAPLFLYPFLLATAFASLMAFTYFWPYSLEPDTRCRKYNTDANTKDHMPHALEGLIVQ